MNFIKKIEGTSFWAGPQDQIPSFLLTAQNIKYVICLRREVPDWWGVLREKYLNSIEFLHTPLSSIFEYRLELELNNILDIILRLSNEQAVFFCLLGKNRTGMLAGIIQYAATHNLAKAEKEYLSRAGDSFRSEELQMVRKICKKRMCASYNITLHSKCG